jgi:hypothetical protein
LNDYFAEGGPRRFGRTATIVAQAARGHFPTFTRASQYLTETGRSKLHPGAVDNLLDHLIHVKQYCLRNAGPSALAVGWL